VFAEEVQKVMIKNNENVNERPQKTEQGGYGGGKADGKGSWEAKPTVFVTAKDQQPEKMDADVTKWREWKDSFLSYSDTLRPGMLEWLNKIEKKKTMAPKGEELKDDDAKWKALDSMSLWRGLKACTTGEARNIIDSTEEACGYEAWFDLCKNFEPAMQAKKGAALADMYLMSSYRAKTPKETRGLLNELGKRRRNADKLQAEKVDEDTLVPILEIIMDEATASKTADLVNPSYLTLKIAVLKYVNRVVPHAESQEHSSKRAS